MKVLTLLNEKGGVGKTSLARHIAAKLALTGHTVMVIDADPQAHSTLQFRLPEYGGLYRLLVQEDRWQDVVKVPPVAAWAGHLAHTGKLFVLPGNVETRGIPLQVSDVGLLRERIAGLRGVDIIVIDTSPTPSLLQSMIYIATDYLLYPTQAQDLSLNGLGKSVARMQGLNKSRAALGLEAAKMIGVVPTMLRNTAAHAEGLELMRKYFSPDEILPGLSMLTPWQDSEYTKQTLWSYAPTHQATRQLEALMEVIEPTFA